MYDKNKIMNGPLNYIKIYLKKIDDFLKQIEKKSNRGKINCLLKYKVIYLDWIFLCHLFILN